MLDIKTISLCIVLINLFLCVSLFAAWRFQKVYDGFGLWVFANFSVAAGYVVLVLARGQHPPVAALIAGNLCFVLAAGLRLEGLHRFFDLAR